MGYRKFPNLRFNAESLVEAVKKVLCIYGIEKFDWQALPSSIVVNSGLQDIDKSVGDSILFDIIEIKPSNKMTESVYLKLPFEMSEQDISNQLPTHSQS